MPLSADDLTNMERGIDACIDTIIGMVQKSIVHIATSQGIPAAGPLTGFVQAINENRHALAISALQHAMVNHPQLEEEDEATNET